MAEEWGWLIFVIGTVFFFGWFIVGMQWNIRRGNAALRWLREGLPLVGEKSTMRWLGSSVVEMKIAKAKDPFRNAEALVVLEPRDVVFLWAFFRARGRRDLLIFRAQLRAAPAFELEAIDPHAWTTHGIERDVQGKGWTRLDLGSASDLVAYHASGARTDAAQALIDLAQNMGGKLVRLSVHRTVPNLEIHWQLPNADSLAARDLFQKIRRLSEDAMRR